ncbi:MAG TPA: hypothetical protein V6C91_14070 [Coleofasciculaceae cyanobacterium]
MNVQTLTTTDLVKMSQAELDELYQHSPIGAIPDGDAQGTAMIIPGSVVAKVLIPMIKLIAWQGKVFYRDREFLLNKIGPFQFKAIKATIYRGESWVCDGEAIILDYSKTSFVAQKIRDEIREVAPGLYLGHAYWGKTRVLNFILEF